MSELQLYYNITKNRESRVIELKEEINKLLGRLSEKRKYGV